MLGSLLIASFISSIGQLAGFVQEAIESGSVELFIGDIAECRSD
jgi:hypothetical protein